MPFSWSVSCCTVHRLPLYFEANPYVVSVFFLGRNYDISYAQEMTYTVPNLRTSYSKAYLIFYCRNHIIETKKSPGMSDNLFETISTTDDNINKIIIFLKLTEMYNLI